MRSAAFVVIGALCAGCGASEAPTLPGEDRPTQIAPPSSAEGSTDADGAKATPPAGGVSDAPGDLTPAYWNVDARAESPSPGSEPLNVILTTNLPLDSIVEALPQTRNPEQGLATWKSVVAGDGFGACMSEELAMIDGPPATAGRDVQMLSLRLGILHGCDSVLFDGASHARGWKSNARSTGKDASGRTIETWYFAVSQEQVCIVDVNGVPTPWHCILPQNFRGDLPGITGSIFTAQTGGYNQGRDHFAANLKRLADVRAGWKVDCRSIERTNGGGAGAGEGLFVPVSPLYALANPGDVQRDPRNPNAHIRKRVTWDSHATHCSIMQSP